MRSRTPAVLVALLLSFGVSSVSAAETTLLRWTHPNPAELTGFRVSIGYSSRRYEPQLERVFNGLTPQDGVFQVAIELDANQPIYVALRAVNKASTSDYSNERVYSFPLGVPGRPRLAN